MPSWSIDPDTVCADCLGPTWRAGWCSNCDFDGRDRQPAEFLRPRVVLDEKYFLGLMLGEEGGFGVTYRALDLESGAQVAVKEYFPSQLSGRRSGSQDVMPRDARRADYYAKGLLQFRNEANILKDFGHDNIVTVVDYFEENGTAYFVMPYVAGKTLQQYVDDTGRTVPYELALRLLTPVMDALRHAHAVGVLHRDVSPENIYITVRRRVILLDFGAARSTDALRLTQLLKPGFTPREINHGLKQGVYSDIYSLAATFYYIYTGETVPSPEARDDGAELVPPSSLGCDIKPTAEKALLRALSIHGRDRQQSIAEFQSELTRAGPGPNGTSPSTSSTSVPEPQGWTGPAPNPARGREQSEPKAKWALFSAVLAAVVLLIFLMVVFNSSS